MNKQEYERWEVPAPKKSKKGKWFLLGVLALFVLYTVSGIIVLHNDSDKDEVETEDLVPSNDAEKSENIPSNSTLDVIYHQEETNNKTDKVSQIADVAVKKADKVAGQAIENANKVASQAVEDANKAVENIIGSQSYKTEPKRQEDDSELSTIEILEKRNHARVVEEARRAGVSTEGSTVDILERMNHARVVEEARRAGVSTEGSTVDILERMNHARVVEEARRAGVSTEGSTVDILERMNRKRMERNR